MIWLTQWLCSDPARHCALAIPWSDGHHSQKEIEHEGEKAFKSLGLNRWCGICGPAMPLHVEHGKTIFRTMTEAEPFLVAEALLQALTRELIDQTKAVAKNN